MAFQFSFHGIYSALWLPHSEMVVFYDWRGKQYGGFKFYSGENGFFPKGHERDPEILRRLIAEYEAKHIVPCDDNCLILT